MWNCPLCGLTPRSNGHRSLRSRLAPLRGAVQLENVRDYLMSLFKNTGWVRLGIVLSVVWLLMVIAYAAYDYHSVNSKEGGWETIHTPGEIAYPKTTFKTNLTQCANSGNPPITSCSPRIENIALIIFVPIGIGWLLVVTLVFAVTWVRDGFRRNKTQRDI